MNPENGGVQTSKIHIQVVINDHRSNSVINKANLPPENNTLPKV